MGIKPHPSKAFSIGRSTRSVTTSPLLPAPCSPASFDRDGNKPVGDALSTQERIELRERTATKVMIDRLERTRHLNLDDFITKELGAGERQEELKKAIITVIKHANHRGLIYKFKLD